MIIPGFGVYSNHGTGFFNFIFLPSGAGPDDEAGGGGGGGWAEAGLKKGGFKITHG